MSNKINNLKFSIAVDGSAASGKSTGSKIIAKHFNFKLLNSGRLYRFLAFSMLKNKKTLKNWNYLQKISKNISIAKLNKKQLNQQNVSYLASKIAKNALKNNTTLKQETLKTGLIKEEEYEKIVDPKKMTYPA